MEKEMALELNIIRLKIGYLKEIIKMVKKTEKEKYIVKMGK